MESQDPQAATPQPTTPQPTIEPSPAASPVPQPQPIPIGEARKLHPNIKKVWILCGGITAVILGVGALVFEFLVLDEIEPLESLPIGLLSGLLVVFLIVLTFVSTKLEYNAWSYTVRSYDVLVCHGVFWKKRICIPRLRIQHVDILSGPLDRRFDLCKVSLFTAGTSEAANAARTTTAQTHFTQRFGCRARGRLEMWLSKFSASGHRSAP